MNADMFVKGKFDHQVDFQGSSYIKIIIMINARGHFKNSL